MRRLIPGKPGIRESRGTKQARQIRALQDRVRRLEKLTTHMREAGQLACQAESSGPFIDLKTLVGRQTLMPVGRNYNLPDMGDFLDAKAEAGETMSMAHNAAMTTGRVRVRSAALPFRARAVAALRRFISVGFPGRRSGAWPRWAAGRGEPSLSDDTQ
jgi:hypothetical protein